MRSSWKRSAWAGPLALLIVCACAPLARAGESLPAGLATVEALNEDGTPDVLAGSHPYLFVTRFNPGESSGGEEKSPNSIVLDFPPGMGGDATSVPACSREVFDGGACPAKSQVGRFVATRKKGGSESYAIYNLQPAPGEIVSFGVSLFILKVLYSGHLRPSDSGLSMRVSGLIDEASTNPVVGSAFEFWGVPADHQEGTSIPRRPFLTLPTRCDGPLTLGLHLSFWEHPDPAETVSGTIDTGLPLQGCQNLPFTPKLGLALESPVADSPTGISFNLGFGENSDPEGLADSQARSASIELPAGMALSPGGASRLGVCSDAQLELGSEAEARCPASSKVGTVEIGAPQLEAPLTGNVYLGAERPGERFRLFIVASGAGAETKLVSTMRPDPVTGRLTTVLNDLPQISFGHLLMHFNGGPRALLTTPSACGPATADATVSPYSGGPAVQVSDSAGVQARPGQACGAPLPFEPKLTSSVSAARGGQPTSFTTVMTRRDGEQLTDRFSIAFPAGLSASLGSVGLCPAAAIAAANCPVSSKIGSAFVDVGSGPEIAELNGGAYLTGPYRGGPFGIDLIFNAALGPFDLGALSVRATMKLDPLTGQVTVVTDSVPQTFEGVPVRLRALGLDIDRPGFMRTPTSCTTKQVQGTAVSTTGAVAHPTSEFSLRGCVDLPFKPSFSLALTDRSQLHFRGKPGLRISMKARKGDANMRSLDLLLPRALRFDSGALRAICARREAIKGNCPAGSQVGTGFGRTPTLKTPLKGAIYVVQPKGKGQPDLWTKLKGEGIRLELQSRSSADHGRIDTSFTGLPDMQLSSFTMHLAGGKDGVFSLGRNLCSGGHALKLVAPAAFEGHNGAYRKAQVPVTAPEICKAG